MTNWKLMLLSCSVDFRDPQPTRTHRATLRLLQEATIREPKMVRVNGEQFDYVSLTVKSTYGSHPEFLVVFFMQLA